MLIVSLPDDPYSFPRSLVRGFKFSGLLTVHIVVALFGTAILESSLHRIHATSIGTVLLQAWIFSAAVAFGLGFSIQRLWPNTAAKWTWVLPALWFGFGTLIAARHGAVFDQTTGRACGNGLADPFCRGWFLFTIPFLRTGCYSAGSYVQSILGSTQRLQSASGAMDNGTNPDSSQIGLSVESLSLIAYRLLLIAYCLSLITYCFPPSHATFAFRAL